VSSFKPERNPENLFEGVKEEDGDDGDEEDERLPNIIFTH
jgi:hypothetical protein